MEKIRLSLKELRDFDPDFVVSRGEIRFLCPFSPDCGDKPEDNSHRSLSVNEESGAWMCHRCGAKGKLSEYWDSVPKRRVGALAMRPAPIQKHRTYSRSSEDPDTAQEIAVTYDSAVNTPAQYYLRRRGIPDSVIESSDVYHYRNWPSRKYRHGVHWVVFPLRDQKGRVVATTQRALHYNIKIASGEKKHGVFATPGAFSATFLVVVEGPIDALSLASCGFPSIALAGTSWPDWLIPELALKNVVVALDADDAGQNAADRLVCALRPYARTLYRLRPPGRVKDWNEALQDLGVQGLRAELAKAIGILSQSGNDSQCHFRLHTANS